MRAARSLYCVPAVLAALLAPAVPARAADAVVVPSAGAPPAPAGAPGEDPLTVEVLTMGPGDHPFTRFGHNALRIRDQRSGADLVYNFGTFSFGSPKLIVDFLQRRLKYWLSQSTMTSTAWVYQHENRSIESQELALTAAQKRELWRRLELNARPENREYRYDYFADNCSTRVRDALDGVLDGRLRRASVGQGSMSLRAHALRMAADDIPFYVALLIVLGPRADRPIDEWAEGFLPEMLQRALRGVDAGDALAPSQRLVRSERILFQADRPPPRREAPNRLPAFLGIGMLAGGLLVLLGRAGVRRKPLRFFFGVLVVLVGVGAGFIGSFLTWAWAFTPHAVVYRNENVLLFAPFALALGVFGVGTAVGRGPAARKTYLLAACALGLAIAACALKLFPWSRQENGALILLMLPTWLGMTAGARALAGVTSLRSGTGRWSLARIAAAHRRSARGGETPG
jgi:hypothetical protein